MSKIAEKIKKAVSSQSWQDVCDVYFSLTGQKISPPKTENAVDPLGMNKKDLYAYLKNTMKLDFLLKITSYELDDLRLIYESNINRSDEAVAVEYVEEHVDLSDVNASPQPEYTFLAKSKAARALNNDRVPINITLKDFSTYGDEPKSTVPRNRASRLVSARCKKCNKVSKVSDLVVIKGTENERTYICAGCS